MNNRRGYFLTSLIFIFFAGASTYVAYSRQQPVQNSQGSISGCLSSQQKPQAGIIVKLIGPRRPGEHEKLQVAEVVTDDGGNYNFRSVAQGTYDVVPVTGAYVITDLTQNQLPGKSLMVGAGENVSDINFDLLLAATIKGQIRDADGHPVVSERLSLILAEKHVAPGRFPVRGVIVRPSDAQGNYTIDKVPPGRYLLSNEEPVVAIVTDSPRVSKRLYPLTYYPSGNDQKSATVIEVAPGAVLTGIDIIVGPPLKTYQIAGRVIDEITGAPVANVGFSVLYEHGESYRGSYSDDAGGVKTDSAGQFSIPVALPGHFTLQPEPDFADNLYGDNVKFEIVDKDMTGLEIKIHRGATLSGKIVIEGASATSDMEKLLKERYFVSLQRPGTSAGFEQKTIDPDGNFQVVGVGSGLFKLGLEIGVQGQSEFSILKVRRDDQDLTRGIEVASGREVSGLQVIVRNNAKNMGSIRGQVKVEGGELEGVNLYVNYRRVDGEPNSYGSAMLDTRGRFVTEKALPGDYELMIGPMSLAISNETGSKTMQRMPTVKQIVKVTAGAESEVTLVMTLRPQ